MAGLANGLATVGRWQTYFGTGLGGAVILFFVALFLYLGVKAAGDHHSGRATAAAAPDAACADGWCRGNVSYTVAGRSYSAPLQWEQQGGKLEVRYDPRNPSDAEAAGIPARWLFGAACVLLVLLAALVANAVLVAKSKAYAAVTGAGDLLYDFSDLS